MTRALLFTVLIAASICSFSQRIVTAGGAMTETVCALGECSRIVASDKTSLYPPDIQNLPSIGYRTSISAEGIISLKPALVIAEKDYVDESVLAQIRSTGIKAIVVDRAYSFEGTKNLIRTIAAELNKQAEGEKIISKIEGELAEAAALVNRSGTSPRVLCVYNRGTSSFDAAGTKTFSEILPYVGAKNAIEGVNGYKPLNIEAMIAANPDYMLLFESGLKSLGGVEGLLNVPGVLQTKAGKDKKIIAMDGVKLSNFGPRFGEAVKELASLLHPDLKSGK
ncbi:MAG TPA: ABC transporter substrate-binding protein [Cyclobacteriaceae bacterium]|nr:ABC transporter substrate-binding protein [Cyclobacteriaceae bacterium]